MSWDHSAPGYPLHHTLSESMKIPEGEIVGNLGIIGQHLGFEGEIVAALEGSDPAVPRDGVSPYL